MVERVHQNYGRSIRAGFAIVTAVGVMLLLGAGARAGEYDVGPIHIADPWARATPKGASSAAAYLAVTNNGPVPERLSCAGSDGVMKMRPVEGGLEIRPGEMITLKPGGDHLMLTQIKHPLEAGKTVQATLLFEKAGTVKVEFPILAMGAAAPGAPAGGGSMMMEGHGGQMMHMQPGQH